jgi:predicted nucleic acid-binding protein
MKILIDTNVALDVLMKRQSFLASGIQVLGLSKLGIEVFLSASAITDIYYIISRTLNSKKNAMSLLKNLLATVDVAAITGNEIRQAVSLDWDDFEDAVQYAVGESIAVNYIVTRNKADFSSSSLPIVSPDELLALLMPPDESNIEGKNN